MNAREELARFLHNVYEIQAKIMGWKTQDSCQVEFDKLPEANKRVMLTVAQAVIDVGFVRLEDVEVDEKEICRILIDYYGISAFDIEKRKTKNEVIAHAIAEAKGILRVKK